MLKITHIATDRLPADQMTVYWFDVSGIPTNPHSYDDGVFGIADCNGERSIVDDECTPIDSCNIHSCVFNELVEFIDTKITE